MSQNQADEIQKQLDVMTGKAGHHFEDTGGAPNESTMLVPLVKAPTIEQVMEILNDLQRGYKTQRTTAIEIFRLFTVEPSLSRREGR